MIGDYFQLSPLIKSKLAKKKEFEISLFEKLCKKFPAKMTFLSKQYRMNADILEISNNIVYNGKMQHGNDSIAL